ncbi:hypothetical protein NY814_23850, partial [Escherichia coli]|nr:hypothetical protein [Escherichia coli]
FNFVVFINEVGNKIMFVVCNDEKIQKPKKIAKKKTPAPVIYLDKYRKKLPLSQRQADNQGLRVNVLTMIVYPALLFCRLESLACFCSPLSRTTEPPRFR